MDNSDDFASLRQDLNDPKKREKTAKMLMSKHLVELTDEFGATYRVVQIGSVNVPVEFFDPTLQHGVSMKDLTYLPMRDDDIMLCSFLKTGTHWMCNILHFLMETGSLDQPKAAPLIDLASEDEIASWPSPRLLHTHAMPQWLPLESFRPGRKIILLYRNPKDTAVSMFHHYSKKDFIGRRLNISWNCYFEAWMKGIVIPFDFFLYFNAWERALEENKNVEVLVVHYEDMKKDGLKELRRIQEYLGIKRSDERLQQVLDRCSINKLREDVNEEKVKTNSLVVDDEGRSILYRKGIVGDWKNHFTVTQSEQFDARIEEKFKNSIFKRPVP